MKKSRKPTAFEERVYAQLRRIPCGRVMTYAGLARAVGCGSPRAVGQALRRNPCAPEVPCHRVVRSDLTLGGYSGETSGPVLEKKVQLLRREGVGLDSDGRLLDKTVVWEG